MNTKVLSEPNGLSSGAALWILPQPAVSRWSAKIDWYLNGLITQAEQRQPQVLSQVLTKILKDEELTVVPTYSDKHSPLLISSEPYLPNQKTVVVEYEGNVKEWVAKFIQTWNQLQSPTVRIFLPSTIKSQHFLDQLPKMKFESSESLLHVTVVDDKSE